jgi:hypothetical protein
MAFDVQAAKADGYTDEEIQAYLASENTPTPAQAASAAGQPVPQYQPIDRSEEYKGLAQGMGLETLKTGAELGLAYYGGKKLLGAAGKAFSGPVAPTPTPAQQTFNTLKATDAQNAARATQQPGIMDRANQVVRQLALDKVVKSAGVPAAVGMGGAAATGLAAGQMRAMTPEQRKQFYDNPMLGAMGGDAALAAAIMNRGQ